MKPGSSLCTLLLIPLIALVAFAATSTNKTNPSKQDERQPVTAQSQQTSTQSLADHQLQQLIQAKFSKSKLQNEPISVYVRGGVAYIDGKTRVPQRKGLATRLAREAGARKVVNRVQVISTKTTARPEESRSRRQPRSSTRSH